MSDIIEKLGITPGPWFISRPDPLEDYTIENRFKYKNNLLRGTLIDGIGSRKDAQLIAAAPEMLYALIEYYRDYEHAHEAGQDWPIYHSERMKGIIEKACKPLTWQQIKELL